MHPVDGLPELPGLRDGMERVLRVARTIADLAGADAVAVAHVDEAARFRSPDARAAARAAS